jgi:hypothetical protein
MAKRNIERRELATLATLGAAAHAGAVRHRKKHPGHQKKQGSLFWTAVIVVLVLVAMLAIVLQLGP